MKGVCCSQPVLIIDWEFWLSFNYSRSSCFTPTISLLLHQPIFRKITVSQSPQYAYASKLKEYEYHFRSLLNNTVLHVRLQSLPKHSRPATVQMVWKWLKKRHRALRRSNLYQVARITILVALIWSFIDAIYVQHRYATDLAEEPPALGSEKIYITSIHWNNGGILKSHWVNAVLNLAKEIGPDNVFVSLHESGSWDDSKGALQNLDAELEAAGIRRRITLDPTTHSDEINKPPADTGWVWTPRKQMELRRIPYLAGLRNLAMEPLYELQKQGEKFDKILFLNDVVFTSLDVRNLLSTRDGEYSAACSLDFKNPPDFYDTFALRDSEGQEFLTQTWPFFRSRSSRRAMKSNSPVPVASCWNGIVAMDATPFYSDKVAFRGIPDSLSIKHLEGSECCLIHVDNPLSSTKGVWLNPRVRVGYSGQAYNGVNPEPPWQSTFGIWKACWKNRILRWFTTTWFKNQTVYWRLWRWRREDQTHTELGDFCVINEMHVLIYNGWAHV